MRSELEFVKTRDPKSLRRATGLAKMVMSHNSRKGICADFEQYNLLFFEVEKITKDNRGQELTVDKRLQKPYKLRNFTASPGSYYALEVRQDNETTCAVWDIS